MIKGKAGSELDREDIKRKIEKLLALSKSTNKSEAMSAAQTARKLMLKYHISMTEEGGADEGSLSAGSQVSIKELRFKRTPMNQHHLMLAFILAKNFRCKTFHLYGAVPRIKFIGFEEDADAALVLLQYLVRFMEQGAKRYGGQKNQEHSWRDGFCIGVDHAFEAQNQENPGYALMLATPAEVMDAYGKLKLKKGPGTKRRAQASLDGSAFAHGADVGKQAVDGRSIPAGKQYTSH